MPLHVSVRRRRSLGVSAGEPILLGSRRLWETNGWEWRRRWKRGAVRCKCVSVLSFAFHFSAQDLNTGETPVRAPVQRVQRVSAGLAHELKFSWPSKEVVWQ